MISRFFLHIAQVGPIKLNPPYLKQTIDITVWTHVNIIWSWIFKKVPVEDCAGYMFHLQIYGGSKVSSAIPPPSHWLMFFSQKIGELASISLPALANLPGFVPAPVTSVVAVSYRWFFLHICVKISLYICVQIHIYFSSYLFTNLSSYSCKN